MEHYPFVCGVPNLVKAAHTPRHTAETRTRHTHLSKAIEANIEQGQPPLTITKFQKCVKFGVHFSKQVTMLYRFGVGLQLIGADGFNPTLIQYHRNVLLGTRNLQAQGIRNPQQPMNLFRVHKKRLEGYFTRKAQRGSNHFLQGVQDLQSSRSESMRSMFAHTESIRFSTSRSITDIPSSTRRWIASAFL